jgi:hypothetical protein
MLSELVQFSNSQFDIIKKIALYSEIIFNCIISERYFLINVKLFQWLLKNYKVHGSW